MLRVLVVEPDFDIRSVIASALRGGNHHVVESCDEPTAWSSFAAEPFDLVITEVFGPNLDGMALFRRIRDQNPVVRVLLLASFSFATQAASALTEGAFDYLIKPFEVDELAARIRSVDDALSTEETPPIGTSVRPALSRSPFSNGGIVPGASTAAVRLVRRIESVGRSDAHAVISGERGTEKEQVARLVHGRSRRHQGPLVFLSCSAADPSELEGMLFDDYSAANGRSIEGRLSDAERIDPLLPSAEGGIAVLEEVTSLSPALQARLTRALVQRASPDGRGARILSTTSVNVRKRVADGLFREDLYYRLNVVGIEVPALRERMEDLPAWIAECLASITGDENAAGHVSAAALAILEKHDYPENVHELRHCLEHAWALARGSRIEPDHLPEELLRAHARRSQPEELRPLNSALRNFEREYLIHALAVANGKRVRAAEMLGISRKNLWEKLRFHKISDAELVLAQR